MSGAGILSPARAGAGRAYGGAARGGAARRGPRPVPQAGPAASLPLPRPDSIPFLQRTVGNAAVTRLLQRCGSTPPSACDCHHDDSGPEAGGGPTVQRLTVQRLTDAEKLVNLTNPPFAGDVRLESAFDNDPAMKSGETGDPVKKVQRGLMDDGFPMPESTTGAGPDGLFGSETKKAVKAFQGKHGLSVDGSVGRQTLGRLDELQGVRGGGAAPPGTGFEIRGKSRRAGSSPTKAFFQHDDDTLDAAEAAKVTALATPAARDLTLKGFASEDETDPAAIANARIAKVDAKLAAEGHTGTLVHEAGHGTAGLAADDKCCGFERMIDFLKPSDALKNADSYHLFVRNAFAPGSVDIGPDTPDTFSGDPMTDPEKVAARRALAFVSNWVIAADSETSSLYGVIQESRTKVPPGWTNSYYEETMGFVARRFGFTAPPALPTETEKQHVAGINDRLTRMGRTAARPLDFAKTGPGGLESWEPGPGSKATLTPRFFGLSKLQQVDLLLTTLVQATPEIPPDQQPGYVTLVEDIRAHLGQPVP